jgi:uncharacterized repeat protein (TIGR03803 family)
MTRNQFWPAVSKLLTAATLVLVVTLVLAGTASASRYNILYQFRMPKNGANPYSGLTLDSAGNLYGMTYFGGAHGVGTVVKLKRNLDGSWTESVLHSFTGADGAYPFGEVIFDAAGNLYGTTSEGGASKECPNAHGCGVVFKLKPNPNGTWTESVLHNFTGGADGAYPAAGVILDASGNLYGTTLQGGDLSCSALASQGCGVVFKLTPITACAWKESVLYSFKAAEDGGFPAGLTFDAVGNLYGTGSAGGSSGQGVVYKLTPNAGGTWTESVLYSFIWYGADPAGLTFDAAGNLYGATIYGGAHDDGAVFQLALNSDGTWTENTLHSFTGGADGANPPGWLVLILDAAGNLYGTTQGGGASGKGVVFKLTPGLDGTWTESVLHSFSGYGQAPQAGVIMDAAGNLYGTVSLGSVNNGFVYEILKKCP